MLTIQNNPALLKGAGIINLIGEKEMAKIKLIHTGDMPYSIDGKAKNPGEIFETNESVYISQLIGAEKAAIVTKENEEQLKKKYPLKKQ